MRLKKGRGRRHGVPNFWLVHHQQSTTPVRGFKYKVFVGSASQSSITCLVLGSATVSENQATKHASAMANPKSRLFMTILLGSRCRTSPHLAAAFRSDYMTPHE